MQNIHIIASNIASLDEARYFAAMGADWIGLDTTRLSADEMKTIADWVVGPKIYVEIRVEQEELLFEIAQKIHLDGTCIALGTMPPAWYEGIIIQSTGFPLHESLHIPHEHILLLRMNSFDASALTALRSIVQSHTCWVDVREHLDALIPLVDEIPLQGIVIRCDSMTAEDNTDYSKYDLLFEALENR